MSSKAEAPQPLLPAFFRPLVGSTYEPTLATQGPWDPGAMHGGPPCALLAELLTQQAILTSPTMRLARLSVDFLGVLPVAEMSAAVTVLRPGRRVALLEASLTSGKRVIAVARGWFINAAGTGAEHPTDYAEGPTLGELAALAPPPPLPGPGPQRFFPGGGSFGYGDANEWRFTSGGFDRPGPAGVWSRARIPLIEGQPLNGLQRLLILADAANGISFNLPWGKWLFIPPGLNVTILREPVGEWVHMAARTTLGSDGIGLCHAHLSDDQGPVAVASQPLLVNRA